MSHKISIWILGDQLLADHPALAAAAADEPNASLQIVLVESRNRLQKRPYQRKKLVLLLSAMRHYAEELCAEGYEVDYVQADSVVAGLRRHVETHKPDRLYTMAAAEFDGRALQENRLSGLLGIPVSVVPNQQFLSEQTNPLAESPPDKRVIMEHFYRDMRRHFDLLLDDDGKPVGGQWNFDKENRKPLPKKGVSVPDVPAYPPDEITKSVMAEVAGIETALGTVDDFALPVTRKDAEEAFETFVQERLAHFGTYEDAMSRKHPYLFHSLISPQLNIGLLDPLMLARRAIRAYEEGMAPINSVEGFVRQVVGWREYIYCQYWRQMPELLTANSWQHNRALPAFFWSGETDMACLHHVINRVLESGYSHHIERLMVLCNFSMLAGIDPAEVNEWFLALYVDAYEWVVTPNVIGMGLNADGGQTATKPYIASANYINKMGDHCAGCRFQHKTRVGEDACPFNYLYWNFLLEHEEALRANPRSGRAVLGLRHLDDAERERVRQAAKGFLAALSG